MTEKEKLVELINEANSNYNFEFSVGKIPKPRDEYIADFLLENGVIVPPCKVGDKMYKLCSVNSSIKFGDRWAGRTVETNCDRCGYRNCSCYNIGLRERDNELFIDVIEEKTIGSLEFLVKIMPYVGTVWFNSKVEAEKALAEKRTDND